MDNNYTTMQIMDLSQLIVYLLCGQKLFEKIMNKKTV